MLGMTDTTKNYSKKHLPNKAMIYLSLLCMIGTNVAILTVLGKIKYDNSERSGWSSE